MGLCEAFQSVVPSFGFAFFSLSVPHFIFLSLCLCCLCPRCHPIRPFPYHCPFSIQYHPTNLLRFLLFLSRRPFPANDKGLKHYRKIKVNSTIFALVEVKFKRIWTENIYIFYFLRIPPLSTL